MRSDFIKQWLLVLFYYFSKSNQFFFSLSLSVLQLAKHHWKGFTALESGIFENMPSSL